jgi:hypothetical protein
MNYCQQLLFTGGIVKLRRGKLSRFEGNRTFILQENTAYAHDRSITNDREVLRRIWRDQNMGMR